MSSKPTQSISVDPSKNVVLWLSFQIVVGAALYVISQDLFPVWLTDYPAGKNPVMHWVVSAAHTPTSFLGAFLAISGGCLLLGRKIFKATWSSYLKAPIEQVIGIIDGGIANVTEDITKIGNCVDEISCSAKEVAKSAEKQPVLGLHLPAVASSQRQHNAFMELCAMTYGCHAGKAQSLPDFVKQTLLDPFCRVPHKSGINYHIKVDPHNDNYFKWTVDTEYRIHHVMHDTEAGHFPLAYFFTSHAPAISDEDWLNEMCLSVWVDGGEDFLEGRKPEPKDEKSDYRILREGEWLTVIHEMELSLPKEWTHIRCRESGLNSKSDNVYSVTTSRPMYGLKLDFTLPDGYEFNDDPHIATATLLNVRAIDGKSGGKIVPKPIIQPKNHFHLEIKDEWILPGVVLNISWKKTSR